MPDQWQVQIQAQIQAAHRVVMHTSYLSDADLATAHLEQTADISATVADALAAAGPGARLCVLPEGPQTIPYLAGPEQEPRLTPPCSTWASPASTLAVSGEVPPARLPPQARRRDRSTGTNGDIRTAGQESPRSVRYKGL